MLDGADLIKTIKKVIIDTLDNSNTSKYEVGIVVSANPLKIKIDEKITLEKNQLLLARNVTEHEEIIKIDWKTLQKSHDHPFEGDGTVLSTILDYELKGDYKVIRKCGLKEGEKVILIRQLGGQDYLVIDRLGENNDSKNTGQ